MYLFFSGKKVARIGHKILIYGTVQPHRIHKSSSIPAAQRARNRKLTVIEVNNDMLQNRLQSQSSLITAQQTHTSLPHHDHHLPNHQTLLELEHKHMSQKMKQLLQSISESWTVKHNLSHDVRWSTDTHTYDPIFMLDDSTFSNENIIRNSYHFNIDNHNFSKTVPMQYNSSPLPKPHEDYAQVSSRPESKIESKSKVKKKSKVVESKVKKKPKVVESKVKKKSKVVESKVKKELKVVGKTKKVSETTRKGAVPEMVQEQHIIDPSVDVDLIEMTEKELITDPSIDSFEPELDTFPSETEKVRNKGKKLKNNKTNAELEKKKFLKIGFKISFNQSLAAYLSVCVSMGMVNRAILTLLYYSKFSQRPNSNEVISSVLPFNIVLKSLAKKGDYANMKKLENCMKKNSITPNEATYAAFLICLGEQKESSDNIAQIEACYKAMNKEGFTINDVFGKADFTDNDSCELFLKAVHRIQPDFTPQQKVIPLEYDCNLVNKLNNSQHSTKVSLPIGNMLKKKQLESWVKEQLDLEECGHVAVKSIEKGKDSSDTNKSRKLLEKHQQEWRNELLMSFNASIKMLKNEFSGPRKKMSLYPYLVALPPQEYINIMMQEIEWIASGSSYYHLSKQQLFARMGEAVNSRYLVKEKRRLRILNRVQDVYSDYMSWYLSQDRPDGETYVPRVKWHELMTQRTGSSSVSDHCIVEWPYKVQSSIGKFMFSLILQKVMIWNNLDTRKQRYPAFFEVERRKMYRNMDEMRPSPALIDLYEKALPTLTFESSKVPMVCPPIPWVSTSEGGYLMNNAKFMRLSYNSRQQRERMVECGNQQLYPVVDSLNQLGNIPWRINQPMLDIIIQVFNDNGCEALSIPPPPSCCPKPKSVHKGMSKAEISRARRSQHEYEMRKTEMHSLRCDALYKLSLANHFRDRIFWYPYNLDFRGRVYPCPPHLNHITSDSFRSILQFARGEKLGSEGLWWLKLHLINLTGSMKREAIANRVEYCESILDDIFDSADRPLDGRKWWTKSDEPWQTLAACKELTAALRSGDPESYVSHLPIHQDGSCNGLQHYAALGRDKLGAMSVNLAPCHVPQDVYSDVAALVEKERAIDAANGDKIAQALEGQIKRKVIKQTVMTTVYGVTRFGARLQVEKQLKALDEFPQDQRWGASMYLVNKTFLCLEQMFTSAKVIQNWFTECADSVCKTRGKGVEYVTPLGLPVVQPYFKHGMNIMQHVPRDMIPTSIDIENLSKPDNRKQKNAFPPNFIHSLDSTHMMLTSLYCQQAGITFVSVHDCFWTHAPYVAVMNKICREQFVALHQEPILEDLSRFFQQKYAVSYTDFAHDGSALDSAKMKLNKTIQNVPQKGEFDINSVEDSIYFFS